MIRSLVETKGPEAYVVRAISFFAIALLIEKELSLQNQDRPSADPDLVNLPGLSFDLCEYPARASHKVPLFNRKPVCLNRAVINKITGKRAGGASRRRIFRNRVRWCEKSCMHG